MSRRRGAGGGRWRRRLCLLAASTIASVAALEVVIRIALPAHALVDRNTDCHWLLRLQAAGDPREGGNVQRDDRLGWVARPGFDDGHERINGRGVRSDREIPYQRADGVRRIVALGDSFTFGLGVDNGHTWVDRLVDRLPRAETVNLGVNGYGTDQQLLYWEREGVRYAPDLVLLGFYVPDFHRNALAVRELPKPRFELRGGELVLPTGPVPDPVAALAGIDRCRPALRVLDLLAYLRRALAGAEPAATFDEKAALLRVILARLDRSVRDQGARLAVVVIPHQRGRRYPDHQRIETVIESAAVELGVPLLDLTEPLDARRRQQPVPPLYDSAHGHWTDRGHAVAADLVAEFVVARALL